jgi:hypothetical protein
MRALLTLCLMSCLAAEESAPLRTHALGASGLALAAPASWSAQRDVEGAVLVLRSPLPDAPAGDAQARERARGSVSVAAQAVSASETAATFATRCRRDLERLGTAVAVDGQDELPMGGRPWRQLRYRFQVGRFTWQQELYATVIDGTGYCVVCSSEQPGFARWQPDFAAIISSLERSRPTLEK